jgi:predicted AAA+ superfamily ATPase
MKWKKRECFNTLHDYIYGENNDRVLILYGLRRTGKTTLIRQLIGEMPTDMQQKTAFIQLSSRHSLANVNHDLKLLESLGFRYVFIDEVTLLNDFIEGAALFSDIFAAGGMKVVLSGTDSLGFFFLKTSSFTTVAFYCTRHSSPIVNLKTFLELQASINLSNSAEQ